MRRLRGLCMPPAIMPWESLKMLMHLDGVTPTRPSDISCLGGEAAATQYGRLAGLVLENRREAVACIPRRCDGPI